MKTVRKSGIEWHLEDERLIGLLDGCVPSADRRPFWVRDCGQKKVFIKLFKEKGVIGFIRNVLLPRGKKEYDMARRLRELSIPTPVPLGYGLGSMCSYSVQEWQEGKSFLALFHDTADRRALLYMLSQLLIHLKKERILHRDLHLGNIIVSAEETYVVDLHKTRMKRTFSLSDELRDMCYALFSIYPYMTEQDKLLFFEDYGQPAIRSAAETELTRRRIDWARRKKKRAFKSTSILQAHGPYVRAKATPDIEDSPFIGFIKQDKKTQVEQYGNHIRKIYRNRRRLKAAWRNHVTLEYLELPIAPKAFLVKRPSLLKKGFVAMEDLGPKGEDLSRFLAGEYAQLVASRRAKSFLDLFARFLLLLYKWEITHRDLKTSNIFVMQDWSFRVLDLEDIRFEGLRGDFLKNALVQLNKSIPKIVRVEHRLRFLSRLSTGLSLSRLERKALLKSVREESLRDEIVYVGLSGTVRESWT
jgi:serine/threonine protein kinase